MTLRTLSYWVKIEPGDETGCVASFPDVPEAITQGDTREEAIAIASEALGLALATYADQRRELPEPRKRRGLVEVTVAPEAVAKIAVIEAFRKSGRTQKDLAAAIGRDPKEVRRILDPMHPTKLPMLREALEALGGRLVMSYELAA